MRGAIHLLVAGQISVALLLLTVSGLQQADGIALAQSLITGVQTSSDKAASRAAAKSEMSRPLPDITAILREVQIRQKAAEAVQKNYLYLSVETAQEVDSHGSVKKVTTKEYEDFCLSGVRVRRLMKKDGKSLSMEQAKKESDRIDKVVAKARDKRGNAEAVGK